MNRPDIGGMTVLHWAIQRGNRKIAEILLRAGANPNSIDGYGMTPLYFAFHGSSQEPEKLVDLLFEFGALIHEPDETGVTPLIGALHHGNRCLYWPFRSDVQESFGNDSEST